MSSTPGFDHSAPPVQVDLNSPDLPDAPAFPYANITWKSVYARRLHDRDLTAKALRAESETEAWRWYRHLSDAVWCEPVFNAGLRTQHHNASQTASEQSVRYAALKDACLDSHITVIKMHLNVTYLWPALRETGPSSTTNEQLSLIRDALIHARTSVQLALPMASFDKIGWSSATGYPVLKLICTRKVSPAEYQHLCALAPEFSIEIMDYRSVQFVEHFKRVLNPDLPDSKYDNLRADLEYVLDGIHQHALHHVPKAIRAKFVSAPDTDFANSPFTLGDSGEYVVHQERIPADPRTGLLATHYTMPLPKSVKVSDIPNSWWISFPAWTARARPLKLH